MKRLCGFWLMPSALLAIALAALGYQTLMSAQAQPIDCNTWLIEHGVNDEVQLLRDHYKQAGIRRLIREVDARLRSPASTLYLVTTPKGEGLVGNVGSLEPGVLESVGCVETAYRRLGEPESAEHNALVRVVHLPDGIRLLVGRDLDER
jgi:hypothetical protein